MSDLALIHRAGDSDTFGDLLQDMMVHIMDFTAPAKEITRVPTLLFWKTCQRQILFLENHHGLEAARVEGDELYVGHEAEVFLAEVLCGLRSLLVGETEVFGQFKIWWKNIPADLDWKKQNQKRIETLFSLVKKIREEVLCGSGSQSYGSLLRRHMPSGQSVDLMGAGHLVQELVPWLEKNPYRILCRNPLKVDFPHKAAAVLELKTVQHLGTVIVVAAPLEHNQLNEWFLSHDLSQTTTLVDLRANSQGFKPRVKFDKHFTLSDFSTQKASYQEELGDLRSKSRQLIAAWQEQQQSRNLIRPFGWDDL